MQSPFVHPSAYVDEPSSLGEGTRIWHFCHVMPGARIGKRCVLGQGVFVASGVVIGDDVRIQNNVSLYEGTIVEDSVFLGPSCVLTNVTNPRAEIDRRGLYETTVIRRGATIGANATIMCGTTIGRHAFVGAGALVTRDVPDYALMTGVPARRTGTMSRHGQKLGRPGPDGIMVCPESGYRYRIEEGLVRCLDLPEDAPLPSGGRDLGKPYIRSRPG
ncbi:acyltransferase [Polyangium mundeleinium]|uniref:Acyltransferase n=1 Tax=Polyangium mundeleinium TaxID=2995306 RepID=A0ABT5F443_9BACT|nr:acyltransferase [Polyangium mundeleinium]MDC0748379.1 acyltransferase [Polyangium mundeleinium]